MKKTVLSILTYLALGSWANAQNVNIPDANFKNALLAHGASAPVNGVNPITGAGISLIDTNTDGEIQVSEAQAYTGKISCTNQNISDLSGIEAFINLTDLTCYGNSLTTIDVSQNIALTHLVVWANQLSTLDISQNTALTEVQCSSNQLTSLNVSQNTALNNLSCANNNITSLDITQNTALVSLGCKNNQLSSLDVSQNSNLTTLDCDNNQLSALDVTLNTGLTSINCRGNQLSGLDVSQNTALTLIWCNANNLSTLDVTNNAALTWLNCSNNQLSSLDLSQNTALNDLNCSYNNLTDLNVANGNNSSLSIMYSENNPNLTCIQHDTGFAPPTWDANNWQGWLKDATASWSTNCGGSSCTNIVNIPDANFKNALLDHGVGITGAGISVIDTDGDGEICENEAQAYTGNIVLNNQNVSDITGLEAFTGIVGLWSISNQITSMDLSSNTSITKIELHSNPITSIDVSMLSSLEEFTCHAGQLTSLDVSSNTNLTFLSCYDNLITSLDLTQNPALTYVGCHSNQITSLDISGNPLITIFNCKDNQLTSLNVANGNNTNFGLFDARNNNLTCIEVDDINYSNANWPNIDFGVNFSQDCGPTFVSSITVQGQGGVSIITTPAGTLQMEATVLPANADDMTYTWSVTNGTGMATIDANGVLTASADGTVDVIATANDGSGITGSATVTISNQSASINENNISFSIVPNPTSGMVKIDTDVEINSVEIYATSGQQVASFDTKAFDISGLRSGVYFLKVLSDSGIATNRIIKK